MTANVHSTLRSVASSASTPASTSMPAARNVLAPPARGAVGVDLREHDPGHAGLDQRLGARPGATGVVARLERHDGGGAAARRHRPGSARRPRRAAVPAPRWTPTAISVPSGASSTQPTRGLGSVRATVACGVERAAHRADLDLRCHDPPGGGDSSRIPGSSAAMVPPCGSRRARPDTRAPLHPDFHRRCRNFTGSTGPHRGAAVGSRTVTAGSELHRPRSTRAIARAAPCLSGQPPSVCVTSGI